MHGKTVGILLGAGLVLGDHPAHAGVITFDDLGFDHGGIVSGQMPGVTIGAVNPARSHDLAAVFDTTERRTSDRDLEDPWSTGNLPRTTILGNVLIVAENDRGAGDGVLDDPDDQGGSRGQFLRFAFESALTSFGADLIDIEPTGAARGSFGFYLGGTPVATVGFLDFTAGGAFDQPELPVVFGDNSANRILPVTAGTLGSVFDEVRVTLGGSGAIDNVLYEQVPAPGALALLLGAMVLPRRRRR